VQGLALSPRQASRSENCFDLVDLVGFGDRREPDNLPFLLPDRVFQDDARRARTVGVMILFRADGRPPCEWSKPPAMIADFEAHCVVDDDQMWRFQSHVLRPIFVSSDRPASITIDPQRL